MMKNRKRKWWVIFAPIEASIPELYCFSTKKEALMQFNGLSNVCHYVYIAKTEGEFFNEKIGVTI